MHYIQFGSFERQVNALAPCSPWIFFSRSLVFWVKKQKKRRTVAESLVLSFFLLFVFFCLFFFLENQQK